MKISNIKKKSTQRQILLYIESIEKKMKLLLFVKARFPEK